MMSMCKHGLILCDVRLCVHNLKQYTSHLFVFFCFFSHFQMHFNSIKSTDKRQSVEFSILHNTESTPFTHRLTSEISSVFSSFAFVLSFCSLKRRWIYCVHLCVLFDSARLDADIVLNVHKCIQRLSFTFCWCIFLTSTIFFCVFISLLSRESRKIKSDIKLNVTEEVK